MLFFFEFWTLSTVGLQYDIESDKYLTDTVLLFFMIEFKVVLFTISKYSQITWVGSGSGSAWIRNFCLDPDLELRKFRAGSGINHFGSTTLGIRPTNVRQKIGPFFSDIRPDIRKCGMSGRKCNNHFQHCSQTSNYQKSALEHLYINTEKKLLGRKFKILKNVYFL